MNKSIISVLAGIALVFGAASCSDDNETPVVKGGTTDMTITVNAPDDFRSRANGKTYGEGAASTLTLSYTIYRADGKAVYASTTTTDPQPVQTTPGQWTISGLKLQKEDTYNVVFWADQFGTDAANPYTLDMVAGTLTVDYSKSLAVENLVNDRSDAYMLYTSFIAQKGATFTMKRPFCQLNIGSNENPIKLADGYYHDVPTRAGISYETNSENFSLPNVLNYKTGKVTGANGSGAKDLDMVASSFDDKPYDFPVNAGAQYMYMAYILAPQDASGWGDAGANADNLTLCFNLGMAPFNGERRSTFHVTGVKDEFLANNRIVIVPPCTEIGGGEDPDPDPDPDPDKPGFTEDNFSFNIIYDPGFTNVFKHTVEGD